jgi:uncharacterized spore protein YtfJ
VINSEKIIRRVQRKESSVCTTDLFLSLSLSKIGFGYCHEESIRNQEYSDPQDKSKSGRSGGGMAVLPIRMVFITENGRSVVQDRHGSTVGASLNHSDVNDIESNCRMAWRSKAINKAVCWSLSSSSSRR